MQQNITHALRGVVPVLPVIRLDRAEHILPIAEGLVAGGIGSLEITLRTDAARGAITLARRRFPELVICAGTVTSASQVEQLTDAGVDFLVTPGLTLRLLEAAHRAELPILPGVASPSEVILGMEHGLTLFKLFPAVVVGGLGMLKALAGPFPDARFCPTGGLNPDDFVDYLALRNVFCVGGSWLVVGAADGTPDATAIERIARETVARYTAARDI